MVAGGLLSRTPASSEVKRLLLLHADSSATSSASLQSRVFGIAVRSASTLGISEATEGPRWVTEPPARLLFSNWTGATVRCSADGEPRPEVWWVTAQLLSANDEQLSFAPFRDHQFKADVHRAAFRCKAHNARGTILSRIVQVTAAHRPSWRSEGVVSRVVRQCAGVWASWLRGSRGQGLGALTLVGGLAIEAIRASQGSGAWGADTTAEGDSLPLHDSGEGDSERILIFATERHLSCLAQAIMWFADGTFKVTPAQFFQLCTVHATVNGVVVPMVYGLLPTKSGAAYKR
ncbi:hypothetical protein HPB47_023973 [Ixodes persulcatus]|uniref:Uncharacterized protein n=1 Tax=Ixodes persulcatus TaxID=34615 RepID=A0AC60Q5U0_IXOPE|nr:hypothetical protein HPB47_023973 [Ixodes persulcatus]